MPSSPFVSATRLFAFTALLIAQVLVAQTDHPYRYYRVGKPENFTVQSKPGFALMGGGTDLDEAFRFLCDRGGSGDLIVLRATDDQDYNPYIAKLCHLNSVATIVLSSKAAANDPFVEKTIRAASAIFISGGDQANYVNYWSGTPVQKAVNDAIARGVPIGGTSAGLAVLGEYAYTAQGDKPEDPNLDAKTALADPFGPRITLSHNFIEIPLLKCIVTDTHFAARNRMGRLLVFLARAKADAHDSELIHGIGVEQKAAVLVEPDGSARVVGHGDAYFVMPKELPSIEKGKPLDSGSFAVKKVKPGGTFNVKSWTGQSGDYELKIEGAKIVSTQPGGSLY